MVSFGSRVRRLGGSFALALLAVVIVLPEATEGEQQGLRPDRPRSPLFPNEASDCDELQAEWAQYNAALSAMHSQCLNTNGGCGYDSASGCSCVHCADYHGSFGANEVASCRQKVRAIEEAKRENEREEEKRKAEAERQRREADQRLSAEEKRRDRENLDADRKREAERAREREERDRKRDAERDRHDVVTRLFGIQQDALNARQAQRAQQADVQQSRLGAAADALSTRIQELSRLASSVTNRIQGAIGSTPPPGRSTTGTEFDLGGAIVAVPKAILVFTPSSVVPQYWRIPLGMVQRLEQAHTQAWADLNAVFENGETASPSQIHAIGDRLVQHVFSPEAFMGNVLRGPVTSPLNQIPNRPIRKLLRKQTAPIADAVGTGLVRLGTGEYLAWPQADPGDPTGQSTLTRLKQWWAAGMGSR